MLVPCVCAASPRVHVQSTESYLPPVCCCHVSLELRRDSFRVQPSVFCNLELGTREEAARGNERMREQRCREARIAEERNGAL